MEEVGDGVMHVSPGQRAVVRPTIFDRQCGQCKHGYEYCCENIGFIGISGMDATFLARRKEANAGLRSGFGGGMAKHIVAPGEHFYAIPDIISFEAAALIEPLAVAWHAVNLSPFKVGDNVMVVGGGPIGICVVQILKMQGAKNIVVAELIESRKQFARDYGATHIVDPRQVDVVQCVKELTYGKGADVVFDTAGVEKALDGAISACRTHGTIVNLAVWEKTPRVGVNKLMYNEVSYMGAALYDESAFRNVIRALSSGECSWSWIETVVVGEVELTTLTGQLRPERMITAKIKLDDVVEHGFETLIKDCAEHCKIVVDVQA